MAIIVTVEDAETGEKSTAEIEDDYIVICAGTCHVSHTQAYPTAGKHVITVEGRKDGVWQSDNDEQVSAEDLADSLSRLWSKP
jgi:hypothetical protein